MGAFERQPPVQPVIVWNEPSSIAVGTALGNAQLSAVAPTPGTFVYDPQPGTILELGAGQTLSVTFTPDDTEYFLPTSASVRIDVRARLDFGDAPDSFATSLANDGPRHQQSSLRLGDTIDYELDGQPHWRAGGDGLEDDGVSLVTSLVADPRESTTATLSIEASAAAMLDAWIDFNGNGVFDHPAEHIGDGESIRLSRGSNVVTVVVPAGALPGSTFARFRLSTAGGLMPTGIAADGEVEDHELTILDGEISPQVDVALPRGGATLSTLSGERFIIQRGQTLLRVAEDAVGRFAIDGTDFSDVLVVDASGGQPLPASGLSFDGGDRVNTIRLIGSQLLLDTAAESNVSIRNVDVFDITDAGTQTVIVDAASVHRIDPTGGGLIVTGDPNDQIMFADADAWRMTDPVRIAGFSFSNVVTLGTFVQVDFGSPWQNLAQPSDVNNDGNVTAVDALRIINELGRRLFSDPDTAQLDAPSDLFAWPNSYFDQNGDGRATALDALRVINQLGRISNPSAAGEGESLTAAILNPSPDKRSTTSPGNRTDVPTQPGNSLLNHDGNRHGLPPADEIHDTTEHPRWLMQIESISDEGEVFRETVDDLLSNGDALVSVLADLSFD